MLQDYNNVVDEPERISDRQAKTFLERVLAGEPEFNNVNIQDAINQSNGVPALTYEGYKNIVLNTAQRLDNADSATRGVARLGINETYISKQDEEGDDEQQGLEINRTFQKSRF